MPQCNMRIKPITISPSKKSKLKKNPKHDKKQHTVDTAEPLSNTSNLSSLILVFFARKSKIVTKEYAKCMFKFLFKT